MLKRPLTVTDILLISINLLPLYSVWFRGSDPMQIFLVYCLETVMLGIVNVIRMLLATFFSASKINYSKKSSSRFVTSIFLIIFFILHYGFFVFVQTQIFFSVAAIGRPGFVHNYADIPAALGESGRIILAIFAAYYFIDMFIGFILPGKFRNASVIGLMVQPYGRIFIQQVVVIVGSMFIVFGLHKIFMLLFVAVKLSADLVWGRYITEKMNAAAAEQEKLLADK